MGLYCDSKTLETNWFYWLLASAAPELECYREAGLLLTRVVSKVPEDDRRNGIKIDPYWGNPQKPKRAHCIAVAEPVFANSYNGRVTSPRTFVNGRPVPCDLPPLGPPNQECIDKMLKQEYLKERPTEKSWHSMLNDIMNICEGIASKFNLSDDAKADLARDAFAQVVNKINNRKIVFTPDRAPVFNLLTTTIHRVCYSILNKNIKERRNRQGYQNLVLPIMSKSCQPRHKRRAITTMSSLHNEVRQYKNVATVDNDPDT